MTGGAEWRLLLKETRDCAMPARVEERWLAEGAAGMSGPACSACSAGAAGFVDAGGLRDLVLAVVGLGGRLRVRAVRLSEGRGRDVPFAEETFSCGAFAASDCMFSSLSLP